MLAAVLVATGAGGVFWRATRAVEQPASVPAPMPLAGVPAAAAMVQGRSLANGAVAATGPASAASLALAAVDKEFVEVCGIGRVRRSDMEQVEGRPEPAWLQTLERQSQQELAAIQKRLEAGSVRQRVGAAVMRGDTEGAAQLAASTQDGTAYRLALRVCRQDASYRAAYKRRPPPIASAASGFEMQEPPAPGPLPSACAALSLERLELLEPDDAWPWLARLNDSSARGDDEGVTLALHQIAQRRRLTPSTRALSATVAEVVGAEPTANEAFALMTAVGMDMASGLDGSLLSIGKSCSPAALRDANRRQQCEQIARRMPGMVAEAVDAAVLYSLEERLGLPHSKEAFSHEELGRAMEVAAKESMSWVEEPSCANISSMGRHVVALARGGELAAMRVWLEASRASAPR
ncbi:hypothetical protein ASD35_12525 [Pelomonas sp. Root1444]|nr:hypothetical protein ASD35_12525 [Pelomonas sp. Root1444]